MDGKFTSKDVEKMVELLNFVATNAKFNNLDVKAVLQFTKLLNWAQTDLLPKIESHKFEVQEVILPQPEPTKGKRK